MAEMNPAIILFSSGSLVCFLNEIRHIGIINYVRGYFVEVNARLMIAYFVHDRRREICEYADGTKRRGDVPTDTHLILGESARNKEIGKLTMLVEFPVFLHYSM